MVYVSHLKRDKADQPNRIKPSVVKVLDKRRTRKLNVDWTPDILLNKMMEQHCGHQTIVFQIHIRI